MDWGIQTERISSHTPVTNAIVESSHHVIGQILHGTSHGTAVRTKAELEAAFEDACANATPVVCCVSNISFEGNVPAMLVFGRDVNVNVPILVDIVASLPIDSCRLTPA